MVYKRKRLLAVVQHLLAILLHRHLHFSSNGRFIGIIEIQLRSIPLLLAGALPVAQAAPRQHTLELTYGTHKTDGTSRESWLINGQTPWAHLVWDEDDEISVRVINKGHEPVAMHCHGIEQVGTPWSDGVPGLTQWPIPVQGDFVYKFTVKQAGFQWYHSHYKMQLDDGLKGSIYIRPNASKPKPFDQISTDAAVIKKLKQAEDNALMLNVFDYKHYTSEHWMAEWECTDVEQICIDNLLTNGKGSVLCPDVGELNVTTTADQKPLTKKGCMQPSNKLMFPYPDSKPKLVSPAMWTEYTNSNTSFEVFSSLPMDIMPSSSSGSTRPLETTAFAPPPLFSPQLTSYLILHYADQTGPGLVEMKTLPASKNLWIDYAGNIINGGTNLVQANLSPFPDNAPPQGKADVTLLLNPNGGVVDVIFTTTAGNPAMHPPHPMHKHGVKAWFLGSGEGKFPYASIKDAVDTGYKGINMKNPPLRDDFVTPVAITGQARAAVRFRAVDPGPIILHCHIDAHLATGMVIVLLEGPEADK
ncbi:Laccase-1 [Rhizoctonia solani]|uniref:Laccase-1 n=1 Tax=Rhizoctonia solani TaxID=456999 RepID=A0A0K6G3L8_9AGAM|nr:Laccase-1 [Rhizoctonia solani]